MIEYGVGIMGLDGTGMESNFVAITFILSQSIRGALDILMSY